MLLYLPPPPPTHPEALLDERCCYIKYFNHGYVYPDCDTLFQRHYLILASERIFE